VVDSAEDVERHFTLDSLRELFQYRADTRSDTHDTFRCKRCNGVDGRQMVRSKAMLYGDTSTWNHMVNDGGGGKGGGGVGKSGDGVMLAGIQDLLLRQEVEERDVSAVFQYISH